MRSNLLSRRERQAISPFRSHWWVSAGGFKLDEVLDTRGTLHTCEITMGSWTIHPWNKQSDRGPGPRIHDVGPWITEIREESPLALKRSYDPTEYPTLHRAFSQLDMSAESILRFANRFGMLGRAIKFDGGNVSGPMSESIRFWQIHIKRMHKLIELWDASKLETREAESIVRNHVGFGFGASLRFAEEDQAERSADDFVPSYPYPVLTDADSYVREKTISDESGERRTDDFSLVTVALLLLRQEINAELAEGVRPSINPEPGSQVYLVPRDLLGALYGLFAEEMIGAIKPPKKCPGCGRWFTPESINKETCSNACRQRYYRQRKAKGTDGEGENHE